MTMTDSRAHPAPVDQCPGNFPSEIARTVPLPDDVLVYALEFSGLPTLRCAAGVSRQFYAAAWRAGLYIHLEIECHLAPRYNDSVGRQAERWYAIVEHALQRDLRVAFTIVAAPSSVFDPADSLPGLRKLLVPVANSLPILVSLSISMGGFAFADIAAALRRPAPRLRSLRLCSKKYRRDPIGPIAASCGLFSDQAPVLRDLGLDYCSLGAELVPAFANVVRFVTWGFVQGGRVSLALHFPQLRHLMVSCNSGRDGDQVPPPELGLHGLTLHSLVLKDKTPKYIPPVERSLAIPGPSIAVFHCLADDETRIINDELLGWRTGDRYSDRIAMHVYGEHGRKQNVRVAPSDGSCSWRRSYLITEPADRTAFFGRPAIAAQLAYLRLGQSGLADLVLCDVPFAALRRLRVDIVVQPWNGIWYQHVTPRVQILDGDGSAVLQCPVLETLALLWRCSAPDRSVTLDRTSVIILGRTLRTNAKPVLELGDVDYQHPLELSDETPEDGAAILDVFSVVRRVGAVLDQFDGDEWNDNAALEADRYLDQSLAW